MGEEEKESSEKMAEYKPFDNLTSVKVYSFIRGDSALLTCEIIEKTNDEQKDYNYRISWSKENEALVDSSTFLTVHPRYNIFNEFNLQFDRVQYEDAGKYSCNNQYQDKIIYNLRVFDSFTALKKAKNKSLMVKAIINETVILPCQYANPDDHVGFVFTNYMEWEKKGNILSPQQRKSPDPNYLRKRLVPGKTLEIQELQPRDNSTEFTCGIEKFYKMKFISKKEFTIKLLISEETFNKINGSNTCLPSPCGFNSECYFKNPLVECVCRINFHGSPPNCFHCFKNHSCRTYLVCLSEKCKVLCSSSCGENAECVIKQLQYVCTCLHGYYGDPYNKCYKANKAEGNLTFYTVGQTYEVFRNSNVILECDVHDPYGLVAYLLWQRSSTDHSFYKKIIFFGSKNHLYQQHTLLIERAQPEDAGLYQCIIDIYENSFYQNISYILEISDSDTSVRKSYSQPFATIIRAKLNDKVVLPCEQTFRANLSASLLLGWYKFPDYNVSHSEYLDEDLRNNPSDTRRKILTGLNLEIQNVQPRDEGTYSCVVRSFDDEVDEGSLSISHQLKIKDVSTSDPCLLSPCGENSDCYTIDGRRMCNSCRLHFNGRPPNCIYSCLTYPSEEDCYSIACVSGYCKNLCEETCKGKRECRVRDYKWTCICEDGQPESPTGHCSYDTVGSELVPNTCGTECLIFSIGGPILLLIFIIGAIIFIRKRIKKRQSRGFLNEDVTLHLLPQYIASHPNFYDEKWEFSRQRLEIKEIIGEGHFGKVLRAKASGLPKREGTAEVAVKTLKANATGAHLEDLVSEYELLKELDHPNVIRLLGVCTKGGPLYIIMEYAENGSLSSFLRGIKKELAADKVEKIYTPVFTSLLPKEILSFAWQIAKGMTYLAEMKFVHRDLAARNVLLTKDLICKISDFGLTRDVYQDGEYFKTSKAEVPIKWMALESLFNDSYSTKSDVWSFGVCLWELITFGETPYPDVHVRNVYNYLKQGNRMGKPEGCSDEFYEIMLSCWKENPSDRPDFHDLVEIFDEMLSTEKYYLQCSEKDDSVKDDDDDYLSPRSDPKMYVNTESFLETEM